MIILRKAQIIQQTVHSQEEIVTLTHSQDDDHQKAL